MEKKQIVREEPVNVPGLNITVISETAVLVWQNNGGPCFFALKKPRYLVVRESTGAITSWGIDGRQVATEIIIADYPELEKNLSS
jgi:hypothetical protein